MTNLSQLPQATCTLATLLVELQPFRYFKKSSISHARSYTRTVDIEAVDHVNNCRESTL
jgi:hypothetical protein